MRANNESLSNLRLYTDDKLGDSSGSFQNDSLANFLVNAGLAKPHYEAGTLPQKYDGITVTRAIKVRFVAVGWSASSSVDKQGNGGVSLEFAYDGNSFNISDRSVKPVRTRIPQKNYVLNQWFDITATSYFLTDVVPGSIGGLTFGQKLYTCDGAVNFVDIAVRY